MNELAKIERLPRLIERAASALAKATTAAEYLEASKHAKIAYDAAKLAARLTEVKDAHDTVVAACRKVMADALVIEAQAQCRLADEYDAAQERGEVKSAGQPRKSIVPKENNTPSVTDIGLTRKQIHEARVVRDAEKKKPGIVRKVVDAKIEANEEPTRADVKRAVNGASNKKSKTQNANQGRSQRKPGEKQRQHSINANPEDWEQFKQRAGSEGKTAAAKLGELIAEPTVTPDMLSLTAQQKLEAAIRQHKRKLDIEFDHEVREKFRALVNNYLPELREREKKANAILDRHKGIMPRTLFRKILACLESSQRKAVTDAWLNEAFMGFKELEDVLVAREKPISSMDIPNTVKDWETLKRQATETRRAKRAGAVKQF